MVFGILELIFFGIFFILMVVGTALDRKGRESPKWYILGLGFLIVAGIYWKDMDFSSIWSEVQSWTFWKPVAIYLAAGLAYSVAEFILSVRKMARIHTEKWKAFIGQNITLYTHVDDGTLVPNNNWVQRKDRQSNVWINTMGDREVKKHISTFQEVLAKARAEALGDESGKKQYQEMAKELLDNYLGRNSDNLSYNRSDFVSPVLNKHTLEIETEINRSRLAQFVAAWTFLWPAYAVSLLIGDFLTEIFRIVGDVFSKIGGRFVRFTFADVFKV